MKKIFFVALLAAMLGLAACSSKKGNFEGMTADQLYEAGEAALVRGRERDAVRNFEALQSMYPFSQYAESAQLQLIYANYKMGDVTAAAIAADRFIRLYPRDKNVDYAYFMKAVANFEEDRGLLTNLFSIDISQRDPGTQIQAYQDFSTFVRRFPDSKYVPDALQRMVYLRNLEAQRELHIADFYYERHMFVAAKNRAQFVVENYQQAPQTEDALVMLVKTNRELGLPEAADESLRVLQLTYPNSRHLKRLMRT